jgi:hypothetical protein
MIFGFMIGGYFCLIKASHLPIAVNSTQKIVAEPSWKILTVSLTASFILGILVTPFICFHFKDNTQLTNNS